MGSYEENKDPGSSNEEEEPVNGNEEELGNYIEEQE